MAFLLAAWSNSLKMVVEMKECQAKIVFVN
jgi:hypothetical protein